MIFVVGSRLERIDLVVVTVNVAAVALPSESSVYLGVLGNIEVRIRTNLFPIVSELCGSVNIELEQSNRELQQAEAEVRYDMH